MPDFIDLTGQQFGELTVESYAGKRKWNVVCSCGNRKQVLGYNMQSKRTQSCGCIGCKHRAESLTKHGNCGTRLYYIWQAMVQRCYNTNNSHYCHYGERGITVCNEWRNDFQAFYDWAMANGYDENAEFGECTIDRIDNDGNYEPANCRLVDRQIQANNTRTNHFIEYKGERMTIAEATRKFGFGVGVLSSRLRRGMTVEEAIETPINLNRSNAVKKVYTERRLAELKGEQRK